MNTQPCSRRWRRRDGTRTFATRHGIEIGRPPGMGLPLEKTGSGLTRVRLSGHAVKFAEGILFL